MKAYKLELLVIDYDEIGGDEMKLILENLHDLAVSVMKIESKDIGEWSDDNPLNLYNEKKEAYKNLFG